MLVFETPVPVRRAGLGVQVFLPGPQPTVNDAPDTARPAKAVRAAAAYDPSDVAGNARLIGMDVQAAVALAADTPHVGGAAPGSKSPADAAVGGPLTGGVCTLYLPPPDVLPHLQFDCTGLLRVFSPEVLLAALAALAMERRIVVVATSVAALVETCESLLALLYPLHFDFPYIPVLPVSRFGAVARAVWPRRAE